MIGTAQLPKFEEDMYALKDEDAFLIPTAEVPAHESLSRRSPAGLRASEGVRPRIRRASGARRAPPARTRAGFCASTSSTRSSSCDTSKPETSAEQLELLTGHAEKILQLLELPYRVVRLASGDTGFASAHTYDLEVFAPGVGKWLEVSSCSNFTDFQARRANIRYKPADGGKPRFVHTLNGSGLAFPRIIASILEHHQQEDGSVRVPAALSDLSRR